MESCSPKFKEIYKNLFQSSWKFLRSVPNLKALPPELRPEIAFIGRSNVGKSSLINALTRQKKLARISNTPGCTQNLNYFVPEKYYEKTDTAPCFLVDMPGYGYAQAPQAEIYRWTDLIFSWLHKRTTLKRVYILVDSRHGIKDKDKDFFSILDQAAISYQIILTKADKIAQASHQEMIQKTRETISKNPAAFPNVILTSSKEKSGIEDLRAAIISTILSN